MRKLLQSFLCICLCPLLAAQEVAPQTAAPIDAHSDQPSAAAAATPMPEFVTIPKNTEIELAMVDSVSSATAKKGQPVRMEVAKDLLVDGRLLIPKGAAVDGVVVLVEKAIPGKKDGSIDTMPRSIQLSDGRRLKLWGAAYGEEGRCEPDGPCWLLAIMAAPLLPFILLTNAGEPKEKVEGKNQIIYPCDLKEGYFTRKIAFSIKSLSIAAAGPNLPICADRRSNEPF